MKPSYIIIYTLWPILSDLGQLGFSSQLERQDVYHFGAGFGNMNTLIQSTAEFLPGSETILQAKAWGATAPIVKEAVKRFQHGDDLGDLHGNTKLTVADAITLRRLNSTGQTSIAWTSCAPTTRAASPWQPSSASLTNGSEI